MEVWLSILCFVLLIASTSGDRTSLKEAREYLNYLDKAICEYDNRVELANFNFQVNVTDENDRKRAEALKTIDQIEGKVFDWTTFKDPDILRQARIYGLLHPSGDDEAINTLGAQSDEIVGEMLSIFSEQAVCNYTNRQQCDIPVDPVIKNLFKTSSDPEELKYYWLVHQNKVSKEIKPWYTKFVTVGNQYAQALNFTDKAQSWLEDYESPAADKFEETVLNLYEQFQPLYKQLHAFIRKRLYAYYGPCHVDRKGPIPIHLTGSINAEVFSYIIDKLKPYPKKDSTDVTPQLLKQNYTVENITKICDNFYQSLGLPPMPETFWKNSLFERPKDRISTCFTSSWDMSDRKDYRLLTCAQIKMNDLIAICHETGHIQYQIGYKEQPCCYRDGNSILHESVADVAGLSIVTPTHLGKLDLLENAANIDHEVEINQLFLTALTKIALLPYAMIVDLWRWKYFRGQINEHNANKAWWDLRLQYHGIVPPESRPDDGLDPASKSHIVNDSQYITYFFAFIIQFQIQESLCQVAGQFDPNNPASPPLSKCDLYGSKEAGQLMKNMFSHGMSIPWPLSLKEVTGNVDIDARPMLNYFKVLYEWLKEDNERTGEVIGW